MKEHLDRLDLDTLLRENAELRGLLEEQWTENHFEHCGWNWPHPEGVKCWWPKPEILSDVAAALTSGDPNE